MAVQIAPDLVTGHTTRLRTVYVQACQAALADRTRAGACSCSPDAVVVLTDVSHDHRGRRVHVSAECQACRGEAAAYGRPDRRPVQPRLIA